MIDREQLRSSVADVFEVNPSDLTSQTELSSISSFDSVAVLSLIVALDDLGVKLSKDDVDKIKYYGDIEQLVLRH